MMPESHKERQLSQESPKQTIVLDPTHAAFDAGAHPRDLGPTHFIGIGGAGMSVLAEMLRAQGIAVDGSDRERSAKTDRLESLGITVEFGQQAKNVEGAETVVYSSAIKPDNPEIVAAHEAGARIVHRSDILALLMNGKQAVTVAGAHGKTTTSSMLAHILVRTGADPSYAIGGAIQGPDGTTLDGGHAGQGSVLVAEADESDGSFAKYHPTIAIITNAEADHLDHYGDEAHYRAAFVDHAGRATGHVVICADDPDALAVLQALPAEVGSHAIAYGTTPADQLPDLGGVGYVWIASESETAGSGIERLNLHLPAEVTSGEAVCQEVTLKVPGIHNARNAAAAITAAVLLGVSPADAAYAVGTFLGAARRFQVRGVVKQVTVVDDYAHHPTEIAALLDAARRRYPDSTIHVLFQPHLFSRTRFFAREFAQALAKADDVIVTGIFPAREKQSDFPGISASTIVEAAAGLKDEPAGGSAGGSDGESAGGSDGESAGGSAGGSDGVWIQAVDDMCLAARMMAMRAHHGDVVFTVGAGDITEMGQVLLTALEAHRESCD
jgi:UDP-N-acetylmuramate--alanine ligase